MDTHIKAVIFDIDDTLFDRRSAQKLVFESFKDKYAELFESVDSHILQTAFFEADRLSTEYFFVSGKSISLRQERYRLFLSMLELDNSYAAEMSNYYISLYGKINTPVDGAVEILKSLHANYKLGVISNGITKTQYNKLEQLGIKEFFDSIMISEEAGMQKPDLPIFWESAKALSCRPEECLYIGNSYNGDIVGSAEAGMKSCWYNPSKARPVEMVVTPDYEIASLSELNDIL